MTFRFRAAPLLALRAQQFDAARARLARANEDAAVAEALLGAARQAATAAAAGYHDALECGTDHASLERHRTWIDLQRTQVEARLGAWAACRGLVTTASDAVTAAHRQLRVLERLRERLRRRHDTAVRLGEMKEIDRLATLQHARRLTEGGQT
jgi:flagellar export protein FliJ